MKWMSARDKKPRRFNKHSNKSVEVVCDSGYGIDLWIGWYNFMDDEWINEQFGNKIKKPVLWHYLPKRKTQTEIKAEEIGEIL